VCLAGQPQDVCARQVRAQRGQEGGHVIAVEDDVAQAELRRLGVHQRGLAADAAARRKGHLLQLQVGAGGDDDLAADLQALQG
jgi:hypothetical protein